MKGYMYKLDGRGSLPDNITASIRGSVNIIQNC